jgi:pyrroloquinoline-quinone synthase
MNTESFLQELNARIARYDLLCHPFYKAWSMGELTRESIRDYACDYYHHVAAFPEYLDVLANRLPEGATAAVVKENKEDEEGLTAPDKRSHAELWLDFAEGMGAKRGEVAQHAPIAEIEQLIAGFRRVAANGSTAEALAAFYAYESQIPKVAAEKECGLQQMYGADDKTSYYFTLHKSWDVHHSRVWFERLVSEVGDSADARQAALNAAETAAKSLWRALDGVERVRTQAA